MHSNLPHDLFLLMLTLSQLESDTLTVNLFCEAMNSMWAPLTFSYCKEPNQAYSERVFLVATAKSSYGALEVTGDMRELSSEHKSLIRNAVQLLAVLMEKREQERLLENRRAHLEAEVQAQTEALQASEHKFRSVYEQAGEGIVLLDSQLTVCDANPMAEKILGYGPGGLTGMHHLGFFHEEDFTNTIAPFLRGLGSGDVSHSECRLMRRGGLPVPVFFSLALQDESGQHLMIFKDIQERKAMEQALRESKEQAESASLAKSAFLANMSHEVRTPLNGILGMLQLLQLTSLQADQQEYVHVALDSGKNLLRILGDILDISRIESGRLELVEEPFEAARLTEPVMGAFADLAASKGLEFDLQMAPDLPRRLIGDQSRIRQILFNLVGNAVKFTHSGGVHVSLRTLPCCPRSGGLSLHLCVKDTGIGIPPESIDSLFEIFNQADNSYTRRYGGAGLGLGIVKRMVRLLQGSIAISSETDQGTEVHVSLPLGQQQETTATVDSPARNWNESPAPCTVLVVEDDAVNRITIKRFLERLGHEAICVENGREALEALQKQFFDCVLMDIQMPEMDGLEATRQIRAATGSTSRLPIVAVTAHAMAGDGERFMDAGMDYYLSKPVSVEELAQALETVLPEHQR